MQQSSVAKDTPRTSMQTLLLTSWNHQHQACNTLHRVKGKQVAADEIKDSSQSVEMLITRPWIVFHTSSFNNIQAQ